MNSEEPAPGSHDHAFLGSRHTQNERNVWWVIGLTTSMMFAEIFAGTIFGSMALVADGWHMCTHAGALLIAAFAYRLARRNLRNPRFTFGTGKLGDLAGFASAVSLALVAIMIAWESLLRLIDPSNIDFEQAILVAALGLVVNLACAWLLREDHSHHGHHHSHSHDNNLRAAYLHVLADALTSILAIFALVAGRLYGWIWLDPLMGIVGAMVIARWSWSLVRDAASVLLDCLPSSGSIPDAIRAVAAARGDRITDLHVWQLGPGHHGVILSVVSPEPATPSAYRELLAHIRGLSHVTIEIEPGPS